MSYSNSLSPLEKLFCSFCLNINIDISNTITSISLKEQLTVYHVPTNKFYDFLQHHFSKRQMVMALIKRLVWPTSISIFNYAILFLPFIFLCELFFCAWVRPELWPELIRSLQSPDYFVSNGLLVFALSLILSFMSWTVSGVFQSENSVNSSNNYMVGLIIDWLKNNQMSVQEPHFYKPTETIH